VPVLDAAWQGLALVFSWPNILYPTAATLISMVFAFLPGLSGVTLMALAISLTFSWEPLHIMLIFGAFTGGSTFMGSVTAILFNIPGTGPSAATTIDGYPMAQQGKALTAIGCAAASSALGSTIGVIVLILLLPVLRGLILSFGPPEFLMLAIWGLATIAALTGRSLYKGLAMAGVGLLLGFIGLDRRTAEPRFTFGVEHLQDGLNVIPVFLGVFAIAQMLELTVGKRNGAPGGGVVLSGSLMEGVMAPFRHYGLLIRSSLIGSLVGIIPAVGGTVASFIAYGQAVQSSADRSRFGHGDIRGVIAPEAAHDAKDGGSLAPTLAFGIPGSEGTSVLLAALTLHGFVPGPHMLGEQLPLAFALIWSLFYSNWLTSLLGVALAPSLARLSALPVAQLAPVVLMCAAVGAYTQQGRFGDVVIAFAFGVAGYFWKKQGWPAVPLVTALVLAPLFETNLHLTMALTDAGRVDVFSRPIVWFLLASMALMFAWPGLRELPHRARVFAKRMPS
jgi:putative tricarboxylic transport membrane protein